MRLPTHFRSSGKVKRTNGIHAGPSRCYPFWQEVLACYVVNTNSEDDSGKRKCMSPLEDYYECLHHRKEVSSLLRALGGKMGMEEEDMRGIVERRCRRRDNKGGLSVCIFCKEQAGQGGSRL